MEAGGRSGLAAAEVRARAIVELLPGGAAFVVGPDHGGLLRYRFAGGEALAAVGMVPEDFVGRTVVEAAGPEFAAAFEARYRAVLERGEPFVHEHGVSGRYFATHGRPLVDGGGRVYAALAVSYDITDRKRAEDELRSSADALRASEESLRKAYERERAIARELQRPLAVPVAGDTFPGLTLATHYEPASGEADVGGDFFDAFSLSRGRVALAVADASGKGLRAAARAIQVKEVLRAFTREHPHGPSHVAARVNEYVRSSWRDEPEASHGHGGTEGAGAGSGAGGESFVTLALAVLDPLTGEASVVSAGAEPPLLMRGSGGAEAVEVAGGPQAGALPLGVRAGEVYRSVPLRLDHGDTLLLTTDGLTEARRGTAEFLGLEGLAGLAEQALRESPSLQVAAHRVVEGARSFAGGRFRDDVCLLLARRK